MNSAATLSKKELHLSSSTKERPKELLRRITALWKFYILLIGCLLATNGFLFNISMHKLVENAEKTNHSRHILKSLSDLYAGIQQAQITRIDHQLSEDDALWALHLETLEKINEQLKALNAIEFHSMAQQHHAAALTELINSKLINLITLHQDNQPPINSLHESQPHKIGRALLADIRHLLQKMEQEEHQNLKLQEQEANTHRSQINVTVIIATVSSLLLTFVIALLMQRKLSHQSEMAQQLEAQVAARTAELEHFSMELKRSNRELQDFAFVASHDLQEPLRKIRAFGDRLRSKCGDQLGDYVDYLDRMQSAAARMSRLIDDLLQFSRVTTKKKPFETVDLNDILRHVLDTLHISIENSQATIHLSPLPTLQADPTQMHQLFQNLIGNALKFVSPSTLPKLSISASVQDQPNSTREISIAVQDNGIGIDEQYLERIFTPFKRLHGKSEYEGTGIGLSICRRIVERHGGSIIVNSSIDQGSTFTIRLPEKPLVIANTLSEHPPHQLTEE